MNSTVTSLPWDSIDRFICKPKPQYLPRNENIACIWCDSHKVSICNVYNNNKLVMKECNEKKLVKLRLENHIILEEIVNAK